MKNGKTLNIMNRLFLSKNTNHWLRIQYAKKYEDPITNMRVIECEYEGPEYLVTENI